ncbi:prophage antirepressor-like protein [Bacillus niacini]|uniref:Prophage antirepressor-like protein n=1 Tax=Neobacillus niacini TaxID=86668 RepID=A0A852TEK4_9BACI|nr:phage antirepressor [Neobacillus niacini]NYE07300.1 prophage antirepressor-like protein [Neobacillus niacini]
MKQIQKLFNYHENPVRTVVLESDIWFVAKDICDVLEIKNASDALKRLDNDEVTRFNLGGLSGETNLVNEPGLYSLVLGSRKPEAKQFKRWVTHEVLPTIRKHGAYMTENVLEQAIGNPDFMIGLLSSLKEEKERSKALEAKTLELEHEIAVVQPKVTYYDTILSSENAVNIGQIAEDYGLSARHLNQILNEERVQRRVGGQWVLYQQYRNKGLTKSKTFSIGENGARMHTQWTQKGRLFIHELLAEMGIVPVSDVL